MEGTTRSIKLLGLLAALLLLLAACGDSGGGEGGDTEDAGDGGTEEAAGTEGGGDGELSGKIAVLLPDSASSDRWENDDRRFFEEAFAEAGLSPDDYIISNAEGDATTQQTQAEQAITNGATVLLLVNLDSGSGAAHSPKDAADLGIQIVYQDLALCDNLDIVQNMFLGREKTTSFGRLDETAMEQATLDTLKSLAVTTVQSVRQTVAALSGGQRQSVAVAKAVMWNSRVVVLDEPTAALGVAQTRQVLDLVKRLREQGLAVVLISHNLHDVFEVSDRITVLRLGQKVAELTTSETTQQEVVEQITAGQLSVVPGMDTEVVEA